jgi:hypothetical protein
MEKIVLAMCNLWYYIRRRHYRLKLRQSQRKLRHEHTKLENDYFTRASTLDRGYLLPDQEDHLRQLHLRDLHHEETIRRYFI